MSATVTPRRRLDRDRIMKMAAEMVDVPEISDTQWEAIAKVTAKPDPEPKARSVEATFIGSEPPTPQQMWEIVRFAESEHGAAFMLTALEGYELRVLVDVDVCDGRDVVETAIRTLAAGEWVLDYVKALLGPTWVLQSAAARARSGRLSENELKTCI